MAPTPKLLSEITSNGEAAFPWKLHRVLEESERHGFSDIVSWKGNRAFKVHDPKNFEKTIMKKYFNQTRYKSFQRQLNIYGFERVTVGSEVGSYTHSLLVRGNPNICRFMVRTKVKNKGSKTPSTSNNLSSKGSSRRASVAGVRGSVPSLQVLKNTPKMIRSTSCPAATTPSKRSMSIYVLANESFDTDDHQIHNVSRDVSDASRNISIRTMPEAFSDDLFSDDAFGTDFHSDASRNGAALVSVDGMSGVKATFNNDSNMHTSQGNGLPSMLVCEHSIQDDITDLGNSIRSNTTQAAMQAQTDPFQPEPIPEHHMPLQQQQQHQQPRTQRQMTPQQIQQRMHQQRQEEECQMLQLQIQALQKQIAQQRQRSSTSGNNSNFRCSGFSATGPSNRGMVTPTLSPNQSLCFERSTSRSNHPLCPVENNSQGFTIDPTPIYDPVTQRNPSNNTMNANRQMF